MGRAPCCDKANVKKGPWSPEEDAKLKEFIEKHGTCGNWIALPKKVGLKRCGKSCRLRWLNYLRPNIKHGEFSDEEDKIICSLFASIGSRWSIIASQLPGRTDNDIKNYWNTKLKKKMMMAMNNHSVEKKPQQVTLLSILQNSTSPSSFSFSDSCSNNNSYYHSHGTFTGSRSSLLSGNSSTCSASANSIFQPQESFISCSSSDGSSNNQISHVIEQELVYGDATFVEQIGDVNYFYNGVEDTQKLMFSNACSVVDGWIEKQNGLWGENENPLDNYGLEEIKEVISTSSCNNFLFDDDKKTEEKVMYY